MIVGLGIGLPKPRALAALTEAQRESLRGRGRLGDTAVRATRNLFGTRQGENGWRREAGGQLSIGVASMCDYSLHHVASRPARVGDKLVSTSFVNSGTRGFAAVGEPNVAVCLLAGTELAFEEDLQCEAAYGFGFKRLSHKVARFRQVDKDQPSVHHDECGAVQPSRRRDLRYLNNCACCPQASDPLAAGSVYSIKSSRRRP
jgi:hypothetical protein